MLDDKIIRLRGDLDEVKRTRSVQRAGRRRSGTPVVALVGYTNSGKSTLFNRLTGADVFAKDSPSRRSIRRSASCSYLRLEKLH